MSDEFMIHVGMGSHARLVSEWAHYKSWAETSADEVESLRRQLAALRRGLQQLVGAPDVPVLSDAELFTLLGEALEHKAAPVGQHTAWVGYSEQPDTEPSLIVGLPPEMSERVKSWPSFSIDVETLPGERVGDALARGLREVPVRAPGESPWLVPPQPTPPVTVLGREQERLQAEQLERERQWEAGETLPDGTHALFQADSQPPVEQDGPATESMPPIEEPPAVPDGYVLGRVFTRGDAIPDDTTALPRLLLNRLGDVWHYSGSPDPGYPETAAFFCEAMHVENTLGGLLHMHGTLWELLNAPSKAEQAGEQVSGE